jgi:peptidyl-tRNA hydrolase
MKTTNWNNLKHKADPERVAELQRGIERELSLSVDDRDVLSVYVVVNGSLGMSPGKVAAQAFHGGQSLYVKYFTGELMADGMSAMDEWVGQGRRVVVRLAETDHLFNRAKRECLGIVQRDEGLTEVPHGAQTVFITIPYTRKDAPKILSHKKIQLY